MERTNPIPSNPSQETPDDTSSDSQTISVKSEPLEKGGDGDMRHIDPESERALVDNLVQRWRDRRKTPPPKELSPAEKAGFEEMVVTKPPGLIRRFLTVQRHSAGLVYGSAVAVARDREQFAWVKGFPLFLIRIAAFFVKPLVRKDLRQLPLEVQLRRRLELLGPTYIKLGQVLALREDILPHFITEELKNLLDRLPVMPFADYLDRVSQGLGRPVEEMFEWVDPTPLGSASIGQIHRARTVGGDDVILKVVKPHIYIILKRDARLLGWLGTFLQVFFSRFQPKRILNEFTDYTLREVDLRLEADNAEIFAMNFADIPAVRFPKI
ncbi:MAG: AarF/UbiB family protein, partial [Rubricoccaceae bacterium]|nr:AarF/UbiB family protein [Rubricoccaceae bacterium]